MAVSKNALIICVITVAVFLLSCNKTGLFKDDDLDIKKAPLENDSFRVDGYYFTPNEETSDIYFFYKNGVVLDAGTYKTIEIPGLEEELKTYNDYREKWNWGVVEVSKTKIKFEQWNPEEGGLKAYTHEGIV